MMGETNVARWLYSSCHFIVHGMNYVLHLCLWEDGCVSSMLGMGPGLVLMSPHRGSKRVNGFEFVL